MYRIDKLPAWCSFCGCRRYIRSGTLTGVSSDNGVDRYMHQTMYQCSGCGERIVVDHMLALESK